MKTALRYTLLVCLLAIFPGGVGLASFTSQEEVTKQNQDQYGISIKVYPDKAKPDKYVIEVKDTLGKCCWLYQYGIPQGARSGKKATVELAFGDNDKAVYVLDKKHMKSAILLLDFCHPVLDGGAYYVVKLSTYVDEK